MWDETIRESVCLDISLKTEGKSNLKIGEQTKNMIIKGLMGLKSVQKGSQGLTMANQGHCRGSSKMIGALFSVQK